MPLLHPAQTLPIMASKSMTDEETHDTTRTLSESTGHLLINLNKSLIERLNARQYSSSVYADVVDPDMTIELHGRKLQGPQGFVDGYRDVADLSPGLHVVVTNSSAIVDERLDKATVLLHVKISGFLERTARAGTILSAWRRHENGRWTCYSYYMFYGIQEFH